MTYSSINSNGVQITGGSYPEALQIASIFGLITAFAGLARKTGHPKHQSLVTPALR